MDKFKTKDIYEASALLTMQVKLITLEKENNFYWFVFDNLTLSTKISDSYWNGELLISAKEYASAIRILKDRLFSRK